LLQEMVRRRQYLFYAKAPVHLFTKWPNFYFLPPCRGAHDFLAVEGHPHQRHTSSPGTSPGTIP